MLYNYHRGDLMALFKTNKKLFGNNIEPACEYCLYGMPASDKAMILCNKKGIVSPYYSCNKFNYEPTKRVPKRMLSLPKFNKEDFKL